MTPYYADSWLTVYVGDCRSVLAELPDESVHCVVTSPPYWGLRDYGTATWLGGDEDCDHQRYDVDAWVAAREARPNVTGSGIGKGGPTMRSQIAGRAAYSDVCGKCGAQRQDNQLGLEPTPEQYVANMVAVFREVRRVLRRDGTLWLNLGDTFNSARGGDYGNLTARTPIYEPGEPVYRAAASGLKPKDLVGIPWRVAFALQQPYYTGRIAAERDRVWLAATLDAEGTICGFRHERPDANIRTGVLVFITNSDTRLLDECDRIWPGARYLDHNQAGQETTRAVFATRDSWRWQIQRAENRSDLLRELYPYLISKRQQAVVAWNVLEFTKAALKLGRHGETPEVKAKRDVAVGLLSDLNHARPVVIPSWIKEPPGMTEPGWYLRSDVIWSKSNPMPESVTDRPTKSHEYLFLLAKSERYYFDADAVRETASVSVDDFVAAKGQNHNDSLVTFRNDGSRHGGGQLGSPGQRNIRSVWTVATQPYPGAHFATFPPKLIEPCIKAGCPENGTVLDPFAGSGTTGVVAQHLSRRAVLIDLNPIYIEQQLRRNAQVPAGLSA